MVRLEGVVRVAGVLALAGALVLAGCATQPKDSPRPGPAPAVAAQSAPVAPRAASRSAAVAAELTAQYRDTRADCGNSSSPAFLCSGILFRGTQASTAYHSWNPSPGSQQRGGVSFSFLRADSKFSRLAYGYTNGLIFKPYRLAGAGKLQPKVLCAFPVDSWTDGRSNKGCGAHSQFPSVSRPCQAQGVTTAQQWATHFNQPSANKNTHACGFDLRPSVDGLAAYFMVDIAARKLISADSFMQNDELVVATWAQMENPTPLPIQAFFYLPGGLAGAQHDQKDYYAQAGTVIPIIAMTLPAAAAKDATFAYREKDQAVGGNEPPPEGYEDFETVPLGTISEGSTLTTRFLVIDPGKVFGGEIKEVPEAGLGHYLKLLVGGTGLNENVPKVTFIEAPSSVTFKASLAGKVDFYAADGALLGSVASTGGGELQDVMFRSPDGRRIKYMVLVYKNGGIFGVALDNFSLTDH